jgi:hypothetical protein
MNVKPLNQSVTGSSSLRSQFCRAILIAAVSLTTSACIAALPAVNAEQQSLDENETSGQAPQIADSIKCLVPAPSGYKQLWMDINSTDNSLGRALMAHYMGCGGSTFRLSEDAFRSLPVMLTGPISESVFLSRSFIEDAVKNRTENAGDRIVEIDETVIASTHYGNSLGHFQLRLRGDLIWKKNEFGTVVPHFTGQAKVFDKYDFNPSSGSAAESWRGKDTELRVRLAHIGLPGKAFDVESDWFNFEFDYPRFDSDLIQESANSEKSGYSNYGEQVQVILMTELRSARWEKASAVGRISILMTTMRRIHAAVRQRKS